MTFSAAEVLARQSFIYQELNSEHLSFPDEIDESYSAIIEWLSELDGMDNFDASRSINLDSHEWLHTGRQISVNLPRHTMKVYQTLLLIEQQSYADATVSILEQPNLVIVDDGCGGGTASLGLISFVAKYQKYRHSHGLSLYPMAITCLGIDPNVTVLKVYARFIEDCAQRVRPLLIDINCIATYPGTLPETCDSIQELLASRTGTHCVVLACSNLIRPLVDEHQKEMTIRQDFDLFGLGRYLPHGWGEDLGSSEITAIRALLNTKTIDQIVILLIGSRTYEEDSWRSWKTEMLAFQGAIRRELGQTHQLGIQSVTERHLNMVNPAASYWRKQRGFETTDPDVPIKYDSGYVMIQSSHFLTDEEWQRVLSMDNLLLAWARVRNALGYESLEDTLEIRLFETNIRDRLARLRQEVLAYQWDVLHIAEMLNFRAPKGQKRPPRPLSICRLEDQILATAIIQVKAKEYRRSHHKRSYAFELASKKGEQLYRHWFKPYQRFIKDARKQAARHPSYHVVQTDLSSYYTDIIQSDLLTDFRYTVRLFDSRSSDLAKELIERDCGIGKEGQGIPQGHIVSGALSNIYLSPVDEVFGPGNPWEIEYFRFVDDMIFVFPPSLTHEQLLALLDERLDRLSLTRSKGRKTIRMTAQQFLQTTEPDEWLETLGKEHNYLLSDLYRVSRKYAKVSLTDWWQFVELYQRLLMSIGVYLSVPRLSRKLQANLNWWRRLSRFWIRTEFPDIDSLDDLQNVDGWKDAFDHANRRRPNGWVYRREELVDKLYQLFDDGLSEIDSPILVAQTRGRRRFRFALYRLGQLGFGRKADDITAMFEHRPWILPARRVSHDLALQGYERQLVTAFNQMLEHDAEEWAFLRGTILKAFSNLPTISDSTVSLLWKNAINGETALEQTMASEALFLIDRASGSSLAKLRGAIEEEEEEYLLKNYALLYAKDADQESALKAELSQPRKLIEALEYARVEPEMRTIYRWEPDILREQFYESDYPDDSGEFEDFMY